MDTAIIHVATTRGLPMAGSVLAASLFWPDNLDENSR
jgi:hypothetical protein